jgi:anaerobic dimethyl sulfoxide reductase subunit C
MRRREWPLVIFTILGQAAAGLTFFLLGPLFLLPDLATDSRLRATRLAACLAVLALIGVAALFSLLHLSRPGRAARALANAGSSWLSREILALVLFGAATAGLAVFAWRAPSSMAAVTLAVLALAEAGALVYSMARLYTQPAVPDWNTPASAAAFLGTTLLLGPMLAALAARGDIPAFSGLAVSPIAAFLFKAALAAAGLVFITAFLYSPGLGRRFKRPGPRVYETNRTLVPVWGVRIALLVVAFTLWGVAAFRPEAPRWLAWSGLAAALVSEILGRALFYSLPAGL